MLPMASAANTSTLQRRRNGNTAATWLRVNGMADRRSGCRVILCAGPVAGMAPMWRAAGIGGPVTRGTV